MMSGSFEVLEIVCTTNLQVTIGNIQIWNIKCRKHVNSLPTIRELERFRGPKQCHNLAMLKTDLGLDPKAKFVVLNSNYNFY